jgi:Family of unknown function (DUF6494)
MSDGDHNKDGRAASANAESRVTRTWNRRHNCLPANDPANSGLWPFHRAGELTTSQNSRRKALYRRASRELIKAAMESATTMKSAVNEKALKAAIDLFLKNVSFSARREIETVIRNAIASGKLEGHETITTAVALSSEKVDLNITIYSKIEL